MKSSMAEALLAYGKSLRQNGTAEPPKQPLARARSNLRSSPGNILPPVQPVQIEKVSAFDPSPVLNGQLVRQDGGEVLLDPMGAEEHLTLFLSKDSLFSDPTQQLAEELLSHHIREKTVLVVPAYSLNAFAFKIFGAAKVIGIDSDPVSISWLKTLASYFFHQRIGEILFAKAHCFLNKKKPFSWIDSIGVSLAEKLQHALTQQTAQKPIKGVDFIHASLGKVRNTLPSVAEILPENSIDFCYVPFLLGVKNGVTNEAAIKEAVEELWRVAKPGARIMVTPFGTQFDREERNLFESNLCQGTFEKMPILFSSDKFRLIQTFSLITGSIGLLEVIK